MKPITLLSLLLAVAAGAPLTLRAQEAVPPPAPAAEPASPAELDSWLGPIALYPDPLLAQVLSASTQPSDVVLADRYLAGGGDPNQIDAQPWNPSVKALTHYPGVLKMMDDYIAWTTALGQAFLYQEPEVMGEIQRLRAEALELGNLESTPQENIIDEDGAIEILPTEPDVIYVPQYEPKVIYVQRVGPTCITFSPACPMGLWMDRDFDWHQRQVLVWDHIYPRPADWWSSRRPSQPDVWHSAHRSPPDDATDNPRTRPSHFVIWQVPHVRVVGSGDPAGRGWDPGEFNRHHSERVDSPRAHGSSVVVLPNRGAVPAARGGSGPSSIHVFSSGRPVHTETVSIGHYDGGRYDVGRHDIGHRYGGHHANGALIGAESAHDTERFSHRGHDSRGGGSHPAHTSHASGESHGSPSSHTTPSSHSGGGASAPSHPGGGSGRH